MLFDFNRRTIKDIIIENVNFFRVAEKEAKEFKRRLDVDIASGYKKFIIDLSQCEFADSTFLGVMVVFSKKINELDGELKVVVPKTPALQYFHNAGLDRVFNLYRNSEEAVESFNF